MQETAAVEARTDRSTTGGGAQHPLRVLVIDDNPSIHDDIRKTLAGPRGHVELDQLETALFGNSDSEVASPQAFEISAALDGRRGVELAEAARLAGQPYMVAFVDMRMPAGWDGLETVVRLWSVDPAIQVVFCTAYSDHSWGKIAQRLGHSGHWLVLKKPFETIEVLQAAHALTRKWLLSQELLGHVDSLEQMVGHRTRALEELNEQLSKEIEERRAAENSLKHLATHDSLTGLANRILMREQLTLALARSRRFKKPVGFLLLDLDNFKEVNDSLGHDAGDRLLCEVAQRLRKCARDCDTVARLGGDEFVIVLSDLEDRADTDVVARRVQSALATPVEVDGRSLRVSASVGIGVFPDDSDGAENLIKCADLALYDAKGRGKASYHHYSHGAAAQVLERASLREQLHHALEREELKLWYQSLVNLSDARVVGMEALLRWQHPEHGLMAPLRFISIAEESGLIVPIGRWVIRSACQQNAAWQRNGGPRVAVSVNLSPRQFEQKDLVEDIGESLRDAGLAPSDLEVEVTESCVMKDAHQSARILGALHEMGVRIAIDDFGSGYSSLGRLKSLPVDVLKLDRLFIQNIAHDERDATIVAAVIALAGSLGIQVVAEGIETAEQLNLLRGLTWNPKGLVQCQKGQGYLFSKPVPPEEAWRVFQRAALAKTS